MPVCFDLDGTLTDPKQGIVGSIRYALQELGHPVSQQDDDLTWCIGPPLLGSFETLLGDGEAAKTALRLYRDRFADIGLYENDVYAGVPEVLAALKREGRRLFVATSKPTVYAERIVDHFGLSAFFEAVCGSELDGTRSDKTELLAWLAERKQLEPRHTTMVGDRRHDIIGALNNGMKAVGVLYGYGDRAELEGAGASQLCNTPSELVARLSTSGRAERAMESVPSPGERL